MTEDMGIIDITNDLDYSSEPIICDGIGELPKLQIDENLEFKRDISLLRRSGASRRRSETLNAKKNDLDAPISKENHRTSNIVTNTQQQQRLLNIAASDNPKLFSSRLRPVILNHRPESRTIEDQFIVLKEVQRQRPKDTLIRVVPAPAPQPPKKTDGPWRDHSIVTVYYHLEDPPPVPDSTTELKSVQKKQKPLKFQHSNSYAHFIKTQEQSGLATTSDRDRKPVTTPKQPVQKISMKEIRKGSVKVIYKQELNKTTQEVVKRIPLKKPLILAKMNSVRQLEVQEPRNSKGQNEVKITKNDTVRDLGNGKESKTKSAQNNKICGIPTITNTCMKTLVGTAIPSSHQKVVGPIVDTIDLTLEEISSLPTKDEFIDPVIEFDESHDDPELGGFIDLNEIILRINEKANQAKQKKTTTVKPKEVKKYIILNSGVRSTPPTVATVEARKSIPVQKERPGPKCSKSKPQNNCRSKSPEKTNRDRWREIEMKLATGRLTRQQKSFDEMLALKRKVEQRPAVVKVKCLTKDELDKLNARGCNEFNFCR